MAKLRAEPIVMDGLLFVTLGGAAAAGLYTLAAVVAEITNPSGGSGAAFLPLLLLPILVFPLAIATSAPAMMMAGLTSGLIRQTALPRVASAVAATIVATAVALGQLVLLASPNVGSGHMFTGLQVVCIALAAPCSGWLLPRLARTHPPL